MVSHFNTWDKGEACFVHHSGKVKFYYKKELKVVPFQDGKQAPSVLMSFIGQGTKRGDEIKKSAGSNQPPSQIIRNINRTINARLNKIWPGEGFANIEFIAFKKEYSAYELLPKIVEWDVYKKVIDKTGT